MKCELKIMSKNAKEAAKDLRTWNGIEIFIIMSLAVLTIEVIPALLLGAIAGITVIIVCVLIAFLLSYYSATIECKERWKGELLMNVATALGKERIKEIVNGDK